MGESGGEDGQKHDCRMKNTSLVRSRSRPTRDNQFGQLGMHTLFDSDRICIIELVTDLTMKGNEI